MLILKKDKALPICTSVIAMKFIDVHVWSNSSHVCLYQYELNYFTFHKHVIYRCCNTCEDVREAYRKKGWAFNSPEGIEQCNREGWTAKMKAQEKEGCQVFGYLEVNKVQGNFHFAPGKSFQQHHVHGRHRLSAEEFLFHFYSVFPLL